MARKDASAAVARDSGILFKGLRREKKTDFKWWIQESANHMQQKQWNANSLNIKDLIFHLVSMKQKTFFSNFREIFYA